MNGMNKNRWESRKSPVLNKRRGREAWGRTQNPAWVERWGRMGLWSWAPGGEAALGEAALFSVRLLLAESLVVWPR